MSFHRVKCRLIHILWRSDLELTRLALACGSLLWAELLFWPGDLFGPGRKTYDLMAHIAPEWAWAWLFMIQGTVMLYSLLEGYKSEISLLADALLGCVLWTVSTAACFLAHFESWATYKPPAAMSFEVIGAMMSWWCLVRYSVPSKKACHERPCNH